MLDSTARALLNLHHLPGDIPVAKAHQKTCSGQLEGFETPVGQMHEGHRWWHGFVNVATEIEAKGAHVGGEQIGVDEGDRK